MGSRPHLIGSLLFRTFDLRPVEPAEPAWDAFGHTVLVAFARLRELESAPRISGGKAGSAQVRERIEARRRADDLLAEWVRRLDGRPVEGMSSIAQEHMCAARTARK